MPIQLIIYIMIIKLFVGNVCPVCPIHLLYVRLHLWQSTVGFNIVQQQKNHKKLKSKQKATSFCRSMLAPASSRSETTSVSPFSAASISEVYPCCVMTDICSETLNRWLIYRREPPIMEPLCTYGIGAD